jgi:hypothetical protein
MAILVACTVVEAMAISQNARLRNTSPRPRSWSLNGSTVRGGCVLGHDPCDHHCSGEREHSEQQEHDAPVRDLEGELHWNRSGDHADPAREEHPAVHGRQALRREPENVGLDPGHQTAGDPQPDERAPERQGGSIAGCGEQEGAGGRHQEQGGIGAARSEAVEQQPERQLERGEGQEVGAGEQPELRGR